jgi:hypothetical protein
MHRKRWRFHFEYEAKKKQKNGTGSAFDSQAFLDTAGVARKVVEFRRGESIYSQGEGADMGTFWGTTSARRWTRLNRYFPNHEVPTSGTCWVWKPVKTLGFW